MSDYDRILVALAAVTVVAAAALGPGSPRRA